MCEVYPPAPNWFQASCCALANGVLAYASREHVILIDTTTGHVLRRIDGSRSGSRASAVAMGFYEQSQSRMLVASVHENARVNLFDASTGNTVFACVCAAGVQLTACCLTTSTTRLDHLMLVAGDSRGRLSVWMNGGDSGINGEASVPAFSTCHNIQLCNSSAVAVLRTCPWDSRHFAAVATNGVVALFLSRSVGAPHELCRFTAFDGSCTVQDAQWSRDETTGTIYFAVSAKERIHVFIVEYLPMKTPDSAAVVEQQKSSDGKSIVTVREFSTLRIKQIQQQSQQQPRGNNNRQWCPIAWARCGQNAKTLSLLSCDSRGTILSWTVDGEQKRLVPAPPSVIRFVAGVHTRPVFNLAVDSQKARQVVLSSGMDRTLAAWDCATGKKIWSVATLGGYVYSMDSSALEPRRLYFSLGDNTIHSWNLPIPSASSSASKSHSLYDGRTFWKGLQAKVTCIALHPVLPGLLAYGLDDGRSGVYNIADSSSRSMRGSQKGSVYSLSWQDLSSDSSFSLWSAAVDGSLLVHGGADRGSAATEEPMTLETAIERSQWYQALSPAEREEKRLQLWARHSAVGASTDSLLLCVGNKSGAVFVLGKGFVPVRFTKFHSQPVSRVRWSQAHPHLVATASDDSSIQVFDADFPDHSPVLLRGVHHGSVYDVTWAPKTCSNTNLLASGGADGLVLLWDTTNGSCLGALQSDTSLGASLCVHWCSDVPEYVFYGGVDQSVRMCEVASVVPVSAISPKETVTATATQQRKIPQSSGMKRPQPNEQGPQNEQEKQSVDRLSLFDDNALLNGRSDDELIASCMRALDGEKVIDSQSFVQCVIKRRHRDVLGVIDKASIQCAMTEPHLLVLSGDMRGFAEHCAKSSHNITPLELALLPTLGRDIWEAGLSLYAEQQESAGNATTAATCLTAINRISSAVDVLLRAKQYAEALALQSARAPMDKELRNKVLSSWGNHLEHSGHHLHAVECFILAGFNETAATCLEHMLVMNSSETAEESPKRQHIVVLLQRLKTSEQTTIL